MTVNEIIDRPRLWARSRTAPDDRLSAGLPLGADGASRWGSQGAVEHPRGGPVPPAFTIPDDQKWELEHAPMKIINNSKNGKIHTKTNNSRDDRRHDLERRRVLLQDHIQRLKARYPDTEGVLGKQSYGLAGALLDLAKAIRRDLIGPIIKG